MIHFGRVVQKVSPILKLHIFIFIQDSVSSTRDKWSFLRGELRSSLILAFQGLKLFHRCELIYYFKLPEKDGRI